MVSFGSVLISDESHRLIPSRYPPIGVFDTLVDDPAELAALFALEQFSNPRLNRLLGRLTLIPSDEIPSGSGASQVMAAFIHSHDDGGRFDDGRLGAWYASIELETAIAETRHHQSKRLSMSSEGFPQRMVMRQLISRVSSPVLDLRAAKSDFAELLDPASYRASQAFGGSIRWPFSEQHADGLCFQSVRREEGTNLCVFRPKAIELPVVQGGHFVFEWDSQGTFFLSERHELEPKDL